MKCVLIQFNKHCADNTLIPDYQGAYRANHSCKTALVRMVNDILWGMESQKITTLTAIDLLAAFNTVDHEILLEGLQLKFGFTGQALHWFDSYLRPRGFPIITEGQMSEFINLPLSVPQGSCGEPTYYSAYASTLQECIPDDLELEPHDFSDDHAYKKLIDANSRYQEYKIMCDLSHCVSEIKTWMDHNRLKINDSKTEFIMFWSRKQLAKCITTELHINGSSIPRSECIHLGKWMDQHLSFKTHIQIKCKSAVFNLFRLCKIHSVLTRETTNLLALAFIISHLDYANAI